MINKKLLSEVLGEDITGFEEEGNLIHYWDGVKGEFGDDYINIYELIHRMKEWAYNLQNNAMNIQTYRTPTSFVCEAYSKDHPVRRFKTMANIEIDAVTKCCEWILKETS